MRNGPSAAAEAPVTSPYDDLEQGLKGLETSNPATYQSVMETLSKAEDRLIKENPEAQIDAYEHSDTKRSERKFLKKGLQQDITDFVIKFGDAIAMIDEAYPGMGEHAHQIFYKDQEEYTQEEKIEYEETGKNAIVGGRKITTPKGIATDAVITYAYALTEKYPDDVRNKLINKLRKGLSEKERKKVSKYASIDMGKLRREIEPGE